MPNFQRIVRVSKGKRSYIMLKRVFALLVVLSILSFHNLFGDPENGTPTVEIVSPQAASIVREDTIEVAVWFSSLKIQGGGKVHLISIQFNYL
jgi:hypothetical protein